MQTPDKSAWLSDLSSHAQDPCVDETGPAVGVVIGCLDLATQYYATFPVRQPTGPRLQERRRNFSRAAPGSNSSFIQLLARAADRPPEYFP